MKRKQMIYVGICDDGEHTCEELERMLLHYGKENEIQMELEVWRSGTELQRHLERQEEALDILFLDIEMPGLNGIEVGKYIRKELEDRNMKLIYISGKTVYAMELFQVQPLNFLVKPLCQEKIDDVMNLALELIGIEQGKFRFQKGKNYYSVSYGEIQYFYSVGREIHLVMENREESFYGKLKEVKQGLSKDYIQIHQSYIVNKKYIRRYRKDSVELLSGVDLPISRAYREAVCKMLLEEEG